MSQSLDTGQRIGPQMFALLVRIPRPLAREPQPAIRHLAIEEDVLPVPLRLVVEEAVTDQRRGLAFQIEVPGAAADLRIIAHALAEPRQDDTLSF
jgi:hypothetical protein